MFGFCCWRVGACSNVCTCVCAGTDAGVVSFVSHLSSSALCPQAIIRMPGLMNEAAGITKGFMASWFKNIVSNKLFFFWKCPDSWHLNWSSKKSFVE